MAGQQVGRRSVLGILGAGIAFGVVRAKEGIANEPPKFLEVTCAAYFWCADEEGNEVTDRYLLDYKGATERLAKAGLLRRALAELDCDSNNYSLAHTEFQCGPSLSSTGGCKNGSTDCCKKYTAVCSYLICCEAMQYTGCGNTRLGAVLDARKQAKEDAYYLGGIVIRKSCHVTRTGNKKISVKCKSCD